LFGTAIFGLYFLTSSFEITGDCSISINFLSNGQRKEEIVAGYVTSSTGQKMKHIIGGKNKEQF
jgi:hypothetical protein